VRWFASGIPAPKGSARAIVTRDGKARLIASGTDTNKHALVAWAASVGWSARAAMVRPLDGPVRVLCEFVFARPKSHTRAERAITSKISKPDGDKLLRSTLDALTGLAYVDDAQVSDMRAVKRWAAEGEACGAWITVEAITQEQQP
jgi:crossover junction endodeoxyribonuclease RusA